MKAKFKHIIDPERIRALGGSGSEPLITICELFADDGRIWLGKSFLASRREAREEAEADARQRMERRDG
jgi:hypothetical protein